MAGQSDLTRKLIAAGCAPKRAFADYPPELRAAVEAYDLARRELNGSAGEPPMSDANKATIAPMIMAAVRAYVDETLPPHEHAA